MSSESADHSHRRSRTKSIIRAMYTTHDSSDEEMTAKAEKLWALMASYLSNDVQSIQRSIVNHVEYTLACTRFNFDNRKAYLATSHSVRDRLIESWNDTNQFFAEKDCKRLNYLSMEYLTGRSLQNALINLDMERQYGKALLELGYRLEDLYEAEKDAALGNGGLGRLAACFLDSLATLNYPAWGYGLRYTYGMFQQRIREGYQVEHPDYWLTFGNPWEMERQDVTYIVRFYGQVVKETVDGRTKCRWVGGETVQAVAYDNPIPGFKTHNTINLRLWRAAPSSEIDLAKFNQGDYMSAVALRQRAETISSVLYPSDSTYNGRELRLKQQYFFVSATLQDIVRRFKKRRTRDWSSFPEKNAIQLNDTHPSIGVPELMRLLIDGEDMSFDDAWAITQRTFAYTNHTLLPEALEKWPVDMMHHLLPRHMQIIFDINWRHLQRVEAKYPGDIDKLSRMSIIQEGFPKMVRMGHMSVLASHTVNGVAALHSELVQTKLFPDFAKMFPGKFQNKTNGVTPRRWVLLANPRLAKLATKTLGGDAWVTDLELLKGLAEFADDPEFQAKFAEVKEWNKVRLAAYIEKATGIKVPLHALFDVHVKRIHEYKRQFLNILYVIHRYLEIKSLSPKERKTVVPRVTIFGGKAAPSYTQAKRIIHLIHKVAERVNSDEEVGDLFKVVFVPNYNVSVAEVIIPAAELSQHISTAGMEASGTSNMKFAMNGSLIIGTMDGANIEIADCIGQDNMFIFGASTSEVEELRHEVTYRGAAPELCDELQRVLALIEKGDFVDPAEAAPLVDSLRPGNDYYLVNHDFRSYLAAQERVDEKYLDRPAWLRSAILSTARMGFFSTDRTMRQYADEIWGIVPAPRPAPVVKEGGAMQRSRSNPHLSLTGLTGGAGALGLGGLVEFDEQEFEDTPTPDDRAGVDEGAFRVTSDTDLGMDVGHGSARAGTRR